MNDSLPPDTTAYLLLGLAAIATILVVFLVSMVIRYRNIQQDIQLIEQLSSEK